MIRLILLLGLAAPLLLAQDKKDKADPPRVLYAMPLAVAPGAKAKVILRGQRLDTVTDVKASAGTITLVGKQGRKTGVPNNYPPRTLGDTEVEFELELPKDFAGESVELRCVSPGGTSETYTFIVAKGDIAEKEPNDSFAQAQAVNLPATLLGTIGREKDTDVFRFEGKAGQMVKVEVIATKLGAPTETILTLYDDRRRILTILAGGESDPAFDRKLPHDGTYYVGVLESSDRGGAQFGYRLRVR